MKKTPLPCVTIMLAILAMLVVDVSQATGQAKSTISGWLRVGADYVYNERYAESFYRSKVQFEIKVSKNLDAQIDIRGESDTHEMELREAFITADLGKAGALDFGQSKKRFGIEFQKSKENLVMVERTLIYRHLEPIGFVGRDLNIRYYRKAKPSVRRNGLSVSFGYNEAHDKTIVGHWTRLNTLGSLALGASGVFQFGRIGGEAKNVWGFDMELLRDTEAHHVEIEAVVGQDPFASALEKLIGDGKKVYFFGGKILYGHRINTARRLLKAFEPVLVSSLLVRDLDVFEVNTFQFLVGTNFYLAPQLRLSLNGDLLLANSLTNRDERTAAGSNVIMQAQIKW